MDNAVQSIAERLRQKFTRRMRLMATYPPKPRIALSIGVIGHRPDRLSDSGDVADEIGRVLDLIVAKVGSHKEGLSPEIFSDVAPSLTIVSALAEGADRMVAQAGLVRGMRLDVVLPFIQSEYANDFPSETSKAEFGELLSRAGAVLVLPGDRQDEGKAYEAAGLTLLDQSDIVIAVWDGGVSRGRGGTTALVDAAARFSVPVIHVDAKAAVPTLLKWAGLAQFPVNVGALSDVPREAFADNTAMKLVDRLLQVPSTQVPDADEKAKQKGATSGGAAEQKEGTPAGSTAEQEALTRYFNRGFYRLNRSFFWPLLQAGFGIRRLGSGDVLLERPGETARTCARWLSSLDCSPAAAPAIDAYGFADAIAIRHGNVFRGSFISNFALAAGAVVCAALSLMFMDYKKSLTVVEIALLFVLVVKTLVSRWRNWHTNWLEAREVAERLRAALPLWALGARPANYHGDESTWTGWYVRAVLRELGLRPGILDVRGAAAARCVLKAVIADQIGYHRRTAKRMEKLEHRMEIFGLALFVLTFLLGVGYLLAATLAGPVPNDWAKVVGALSAALPAIASASYGIRVIGEFDGTSQRSQRTEHELRKLTTALVDDERVAPTDVARLRARAQATADVLLGDVAQWRVAAESRGLAIPG
jgi:hypothetical protein